MKKRNECLLVLTAFIWGVAFVAQTTGGQAVGPYTFNCIRTLIGAGELVIAIRFLDKAGLCHPPKTKKEKKQLLTGGIACGVVLSVASNLQQLGIYLGTPAGKAGFLTACYILLVPLLGLFLGRKCGLHIWIGVGLTLIGLYLLCVEKNTAFRFSDILLMICALGFACHILVIDHFSPYVDGVRMSCIQFITAGLITAVPMILFDMKPFSGGFALWYPALLNPAAWISILYAGLFSSGIAYTLQIIGQQGVNPTVASLLMSLESVFSVLAGWLLLQQKLSIKALCGCGLIFAAVVLAQLPVSAFKKLKN